MKKRDKFALSVLRTLLAAHNDLYLLFRRNPNNKNFQENYNYAVINAISNSYAIADLMLEERRRNCPNDNNQINSPT